MKKRRFDEMRNASNHRNTKQKEVIQTMRKGRGIGSWMSVIAMVVAVMGMSLLFVQVAGAASYTITFSWGTGGSISCSGSSCTNTPCSVSVVGGTDKAFTINPNTGYAIATLTVDNSPVVPPRKTWKFAKVNATHSISATFTLDSDNDGIPDYLEQAAAGITVWGINYPPCTQGMDRTTCVDKNSKDVFVVLVPAPGGYFSGLDNPLQYVTKSVSAGGLPITVHLIPLPAGYQDTSDRFLNITSTNPSAEKYVRITESLATTGDATVLGQSTCGTPDQDLGTVWTQKIVNHIISVDRTAATPEFIATYIKHTIAHELGHMVGPLAPVYNANYAGYHYQTLPNDKIMNQYVYHDNTGFYIGTSYTSDDQAGIKLK